MLARRGGRRRPQRPPLVCCLCSSVQGSIAALASHLRSCADSKSLREAHHHIVKQDLHRNPFLLNLLLHVYGECAALNDSQAVFSTSPRDVFSYNFMIAAYACAEDHIKVLHLFWRMHLELILPDQVTYISVFSSLASLSFLDEGRFLHACICHSMQVSVATAIMHMYGKCGRLHDAQVTFQHMHERDVVAWNCIIGVHVDFNVGKDVLVLYEQMGPEGIVPDKVTFISLLSACSITSDLHAGECVHTDIVSRGFDTEVVLGNALVNMYARSGNLECAQLVFERMPVHSVVSWNTIIGAHAHRNGQIEALNLFNEMQEKGFKPNRISLVSVISACPPQVALRLFDSMKDGDVVSWNALISSVSGHKRHDVAIQLFYQMQLEGAMPSTATLTSMFWVCYSEQEIFLGKRLHALVVGSGQEHDTSVGNALMNMYHNCDSLESAEGIFKRMVNRTVITWTIMVSVLSCMEKYAEVVQSFDRLLLEGLVPDKFVCASALDACASLVGLAEGKRIHTRSLAIEFDMDVVVVTALVNMYGECGDFGAAANIAFNGFYKQNTISYNAVITVCAHHGQAYRALDIFHQMHARNIKPDCGTFLGLMTGCSHSGLLEKGLGFFFSMQNNYNLLPSVEHHDCIIDLIGRAGQILEAECLMNVLHMNPTAVSYRTLLGAYQKIGDIVCLHQAACEALMLDPED